ncbi:MAG: TIM barrel protein [Armatimonadaceae bacterium]
MALRTDRRVSVSSWALHSLIGTVAPGRPGDPDARMMTENLPANPLPLLEVPAQLAAHGYRTMELCHFHLPTTDEAYLAEFRAAREEAGVELWNLLVDDGDIVHPEYGNRDRDWVLGWADIGAALGARCMRVIGGKQPATPETLTRSREQLLSLMVDAYVRGVRVMTENWFQTLSTPEAVQEVLEPTNGSVGLCFDFGNWGGEDKYDKLQAIARFAESSHSKCNFVDGKPDVEDFTRCLDILNDAGYSGPFTLVYGEPGQVWESLDQQREIVSRYL